MRVTDIITITELSRLTGKTRPTLYKYINDYEAKNFDLVPYSFKKLFDMIAADKLSKADIVAYCNKKFSKNEKSNDKTKELMDIIKNNKDKINIDRLIEIAKEDLK